MTMSHSEMLLSHCIYSDYDIYTDYSIYSEKNPLVVSRKAVDAVEEVCPELKPDIRSAIRKGIVKIDEDLS